MYHGGEGCDGIEGIFIRKEGRRPERKINPENVERNAEEMHSSF